MTRREKVLKILKRSESSCARICDSIGEDENFSYSDKDRWRNYMSNLNASLSGTLNQMVKRGEIEISSNKGPKGGKIYKLKTV